MWKVVATQMGQYNQVLREEGEVFALLLHADGTYPPAVKYIPKKVNGKVIEDEWDEEIILGPDQKPVHIDFAEDQGAKLIKKGPKKGEVLRFGWMKRVPDRTPVGRYVVGTDFWNNTQLPPAWVVVPPAGERGPEDHRRNHARILDVLPKEAEAA